MLDVANGEKRSKLQYSNINYSCKEFYGRAPVAFSGAVIWKAAPNKISIAEPFHQRLIQTIASDKTTLY